MRTKNSDLLDGIVEFIDEFADEHGYPPTVREIAQGTGMSNSNAHRYISTLKESGRIDISSTHRSVLTEGRGKTARVPVVGNIACGLPQYADENIVETMQLPTSLTGNRECVLFHAKGNSMINAGIEDGDLVLVRRECTAESGQIVVALVDRDEATLKRYVPLPDGRIALKPENPAFEPIIIDPEEKDLEIQGIAFKVIKDLY